MTKVDGRIALSEPKRYSPILRGIKPFNTKEAAFGLQKGKPDKKNIVTNYGKSTLEYKS